MVTIDQARLAKVKLKGLLGSRLSVVGIGMGCDHGAYYLKVNLSDRKVSDLPTVVDGVTVRYELVGRIRPLAPG